MLCAFFNFTTSKVKEFLWESFNIERCVVIIIIWSLTLSLNYKENHLFFSMFLFMLCAFLVVCICAICEATAKRRCNKIVMARIYIIALHSTYIKLYYITIAGGIRTVLSYFCKHSIKSTSEESSVKEMKSYLFIEISEKLSLFVSVVKLNHKTFTFFKSSWV